MNQGTYGGLTKNMISQQRQTTLVFDRSFERMSVEIRCSYGITYQIVFLYLGNDLEQVVQIYFYTIYKELI